MRYFNIDGFRKIVYKIANIEVAHKVMSDIIRTMTTTNKTYQSIDFLIGSHEPLPIAN